MYQSPKIFRSSLGSLLRKAFVGALLAALGSSSTFAQTIEKAGVGTTGLGASGANANWTGGTAPTSTNVALWDSNSTIGAQTLDAVTSWGGIQMTTASGAVILGPGSGGTLTLGNSGIDTSTASANFSITAPLTLVGNQTWTIQSTNNPLETLSVGGTFTVGAAGNATSAVLALPTGNISLSGPGSILPNTSGSAGTVYNVIVDGANFTSTAGFTINGQNNGSGSTGFFVESGTANFNDGLTLTEAAGTNLNYANMTVTGGTLSASNISITRNNGSSKSFQGGLIVDGGTVNVSGAYYVGTVSWSGATVAGGNLNANAVYIDSGSGTTATRGSQQAISSGNLTVTSPAGITLAGGVTVTSSGILAISGTGNVSTPLLSFGNSTTTSGTANVTMTGGSLYVGSGGIQGGTPASVVFNVTNSLIGANADFNSTVPATLSGATFQAADASGLAHNITISAALTSTTGLTKTGGGYLAFNTLQIFTGTTAVNAGTLLVNTPTFDSPVTVASGATLGGNGTISAPVTVSGSFFAGNITDPVGANLTIGSNNIFTWNGGGGTANFLLSDSNSTSDQLIISGTGALDEGTGSLFEFNFGGTGNDLGEPTVYTLITYGSTDFTASNFSYTDLGPGLTGTFVVNPTSLQFDVTSTVPEPAVYGVVLGGVALLAGMRRRRSV
ncbi:MAG: PEP-CTERM sorting domain-containing protein [Opitutales bacterium]|jgi:autotransporter-associated beta strand protein